MTEFEWDEKKNLSNQKKHGISFEEAVYVFSDPENLSIPDLDHSSEEERWVTIGSIKNTKIVVVIHTEKVSDKIRIISARKAVRKEREVYIRSLGGNK